MRAAISVCALLIVLALEGQARQGQRIPEQPLGGAISGTVKNAATGRALPNTVVALRAPSSVSGGALLARIARQLTDVEGRFVFRNLPAGDGYSISTSHIGFIDGSYGQSTMLG